MDLLAEPGEAIHSPIDGVLTREGTVYTDERKTKEEIVGDYRLVVIEGTGVWTGYEVKLMYVDGTNTGKVRGGDTVGYAQDRASESRGMKNHVHVEVRYLGRLLSPNEIMQMCR